jgi:hypothetical protein
LKIDKISIHNFLAITDLEMDLSGAPLHLIVGENEAGKSSIRDAIAYGLTGQARGLKTHEQQASLIKEGAKAAEVVITLESMPDRHPDKPPQIIRKKTPKTAASVVGPIPDDQVMAAILCDPLTFLSMADKERRGVLFRMLPGLNPSAAEISKRLSALVEPEAASEGRWLKCVPDLSDIAAAQGFKAAETEAVTRRRIAKRTRDDAQVQEPETQLTIGDTIHILPDIQQVDVESGLSTLRAERDKLLKQRGKAEAKADRLPDLEAELQSMEAGAPEPPEEGEVERSTKALEINKGLVADLQAKITAMTAGSDPKSFPALCPVHKIGCPSAGKEAVPGTKPKDVDPAVLKKAQTDLAELQKNVASIEADLKETQLAQAVYDDYGKQKQVLEAKIVKAKETQTKAQDTAGIDKQIAALDARLQIGLDLLDAVRDFWRKKDAADAVAVKLSQADKEVALYDALAKALAPEGIPSQLVSEALGPVNEKLSYASGYLFPDCDEHEPVHLTQDLEVYRGTTPYVLLSKSARYRVGIAFQYALANLAGARLMLIDEADILSPLNRAFLLDFIMAIRQDFDAVLIFATTDHARPSPTPYLQVWVLMDGQVQPLNEGFVFEDGEVKAGAKEAA